MTFLDEYGYEVVDVETEHARDGCDSFFTYGVYKDTGKPVPDQVLDYLTENYPEYLAENHMEYMIGYAEACYEGDR